MEAAEARERIRKLVEEQRARCLWFIRQDYLPDTVDDARRALEHIRRSGDRQAFLEASELLTWLSRQSKETSAVP